MKKKDIQTQADTSQNIGRDFKVNLEMRNLYVGGYNMKELAYRFVLFHHAPDNGIGIYMQGLSGREEDNALLTYCYMDRMAGLSYRAICCARLDENGRMDGRIPEKVTASFIMRYGSMEWPAEIIPENTKGMEIFRSNVDRIKKAYGDHSSMFEIHDDILFDEYRHPEYPNDLLVYFVSPDEKVERIWVTEQMSKENGLICKLLNEPYNPLMDIHEGDMVVVIGHEQANGKVIPNAILPWMIQAAKKHN